MERKARRVVGLPGGPREIEIEIIHRSGGRETHNYDGNYDLLWGRDAEGRLYRSNARGQWRPVGPRDTMPRAIRFTPTRNEDGSVRYWSVCGQEWRESDASAIPDDELAAMSFEDRELVITWR